MRSFLCFALFLAFSNASAATTSLDSLFTDASVRPKASDAALPADFTVLEPERAPASEKKKPKPKTSNRRSKIPASVSDGFELRVRYNGLTSLFWVVRRDEKFELVYANSSQSRSTLTLSADVFRQLHGAAGDLHPLENNLTKCKDSSMQIHVLNAGRPERTLTACVTDKSKDAESLRQLSQALAIMVR